MVQRWKLKKKNTVQLKIIHNLYERAEKKNWVGWKEKIEVKGKQNTRLNYYKNSPDWFLNPKYILKREKKTIEIEFTWYKGKIYPRDDESFHSRILVGYHL